MQKKPTVGARCSRTNFNFISRTRKSRAASFGFVAKRNSSRPTAIRGNRGSWEGWTRQKRAKKQMRDDFLMVKTFPETRAYPMRLELAGNYSDDAPDFYHRYRVTFYSEE